MKLNIITLTLISLLGFSTSSFAKEQDNNETSMQEVKRETSELFKTIGAYSVDKKDEALMQSKKSLEKLDEKIDQLETKTGNNWDKMNEAIREKTEKNLKALRKQRNEVAQWYGSMKSSSSDAWEDVKKGFLDSYEALEETWEKSENEFDNKEKQ